MSSDNQWIRNYALLRSLDQKALDLNKGKLLTALQARGVTQVIIRYEGSGDSGAIEDMSVVPDTADLEGDVFVMRSVWGEPALSVVTLPLREALEESAMHWVSHHHRGWENNAGGGGEICFDIAVRRVTIAHYDVVIDHEHTTHIL